MKSSLFIAKYLAKRGVTRAFEMSGGTIANILDSIHTDGKITLVSAHHEQAAAFAVEGFGRMTGELSVALATSGPGATNLLTGIASCYFDSIPGIFITGQVNRNEQKGNRKVRQHGFQETDIITMAQPITKAAFQVKTPEDIPVMFESAANIALEGRPGPVLIEIPGDLQRVEIDQAIVDEYLNKKDTVSTLRAETVEFEKFSTELSDGLSKSERPMILAGGGIRAGKVHPETVEFIETLGIPVVKSLMGLDVLSHDHPLRVGMIGVYGNRWANLALSEADLVVVLGSRLDIRQTGADINSFTEGRTFFHIDIDDAELNNRLPKSTTLKAELADFFKHMKSKLGDASKKGTLSSWLSRIQELKKEWPDTAELKGFPGINPNDFMHKLSSASKYAAAYVVDVGSHQMWAAQSLDIESHQRLLNSGGLASMGFALPAAIGASLSTEKPSPIIVIAGDGCMQANIQELQTIQHHKLPIKTVVMNNQSHGMVRQFQDSYFEGRYASTVLGYSAPTFSKIAEAYGMKAKTITKPEEVEAAVKWLNEDQNSPALLEVMIDTSVNVYPKMAFGKKFGSMEPHVKPEDLGESAK